MQYELNTPCTAADLAPLKAGDTVLLSGVVYTARDQAHKRMIEALDKGEALRFSHENPDVQALYRDYLGKPLGEKSHHLLHTDHLAWEMPQAQRGQ